MTDFLQICRELFKKTVDASPLFWYIYLRCGEVAQFLSKFSTDATFRCSPASPQDPGLQESFGRLNRAGLVLHVLACTQNPMWSCFGSCGSAAIPPGTAGPGASAQAARPKAFSFSLITNTRAFGIASVRRAPLPAFPGMSLSRPSSDSSPLSVGLAAPSMARHRSHSSRPSLQPPSAYSARCPAPVGLAYARRRPTKVAGICLE